MLYLYVSIYVSIMFRLLFGQTGSTTTDVFCSPQGCFEQKDMMNYEEGGV